MRRLTFPCLVALACLMTPAFAVADVVEPEDDDSGDEEGSDCSVNADTDQSALFGLAALVLLVSGAALRKREG